MRYFRFFVVFAILALTIENSAEEFNCKKIFLRMAKRQFHNIGICSRKLKSPRNALLQYKVRMSCVLKCVMNMDGLLDYDMKITEQTLQRFFNKNLPVEVHEFAHIMMGGCVADHVPLMNDKDYRCAAYGGFIQCLQDLMGDFCQL